MILTLKEHYFEYRQVCVSLADMDSPYNHWTKEEWALATGLRPELRDGHLVDAVDDVLWSFGYSDIARFDGTVWQRYPTDAP